MTRSLHPCGYRNPLTGEAECNQPARLYTLPGGREAWICDLHAFVIEAEPGEAGADFLDTSDTMTLELPDDDESLAAGDDVFLELTVIAEPADA